jgi:hypothetical protein
MKTTGKFGRSLPKYVRFPQNFGFWGNFMYNMAYLGYTLFDVESING